MPVLIFTVFPLGNLHVGDFIFRPVSLITAVSG